ncbi:glycosyltransferase family 59 protein [Melanomma pulvis-pyrius CBS 109.77]|uniref:Dol-P-Glc:Glc(2)Man(9)GlcNAc(2)-PP-Dol alpha-1,2-glucosyltransferase n=1 Tax=Melanomma pulvis-pyrius CBS 109.77 TaxID=1314802 RepID=A0A6A6XRL5_9PLEO|nr:glycosyltransferase family 59 protein [Melanomma pulvis-pyrius CBS 109.77]
MPSLLHKLSLPLAVLAIASISGTWYKFVSEHVPDPYLDEVFHVPQAQRYCKNDYSWDPKITTPPGLYLLSLFLNLVIRDCGTSSLRLLNAGAICVVCLLAYDTLRTLHRRRSTQKESRTIEVAQLSTATDDQSHLFDAHSALNIALFPPLFFFSSLYYTDVISTLIVLLSYNIFLKSTKGSKGFWEELIFVLVGIVALSFRQTNIFWVAVFPAGLSLIDALKTPRGSFEDELNKFVKKEHEEKWRCMVPGCSKLFRGHQSWRAHVEKHTEWMAKTKKGGALAILKKSWSQDYVYDCSIQDAGLSDCILFSLSFVLAALRKPFSMLKAVIPYLVLLTLFVGFVAWNGGVVLGDKSNHVATVHLPQLLYLWPYIVFFSIPLTMASVLRHVVRLFPESALKAFCQNNLVGSSRTSAPWAISTFVFIVFGLAAVHFNTIVHPFTLADNRHYVFYVFRILRRHPSIKYLAVPFYYICAWMAIQTLGSTSLEEAEVQQDYKTVHPINEEAERQPCQISFIIVWLATTALSVITAPLVEPRYFIVPWIIWRLHVPNIGASLSSNRRIEKGSYDLRLVLETVWLLVVNATIAYNFLYRGFSWPNEPGKIQRFLW